jgi:hypothetical protein
VSKEDFKGLELFHQTGSVDRILQKNGLLLTEIPQAIVDMMLGIIKRNAKFFPDGHQEGISFRGLLTLVNEQKAGFLRDHISDEDISPGSYPGKERLRRIIELLVKKGFVKVLIDGLPVTDFSRATSEGRAWEIVAMETSKHYEGLLLATLRRQEKLKSRVKRLSGKVRFDIQDFFEYTSILSGASALPMQLYFESSRLSSEARMDLVLMTVKPARELLDGLLEVRERIQRDFPEFEKILRQVSNARELSCESERPNSELEVGPISNYRIDLVTKNPIRRITAQHLGDRIAAVAKEQNISFTDQIELVPVSGDSRNKHELLMVVKGRIRDMVLGEQ